MSIYSILQHPDVLQRICNRLSPLSYICLHHALRRTPGFWTRKPSTYNVFMAALEKKLEPILDAQARKAIMTSIDVGLVAVTGSTMISVLLGEELDCMRDLDLLYLDEIATKQLEHCVIFKGEEDDDYEPRSGLFGRRGHTVSGGDEDSPVAVAVDMILAPSNVVVVFCFLHHLFLHLL